ncbi:methylmalonyl-CoA epimerase [Psychrobacillus sp. OK028]|uniref:VOC family protein n=1 Tax=Psychrobacillus sp. OK028 TaxID=1884359 RepID=UPI00088C7EB3|nr:VOC family protein [Psychrobacillus sp. OK028]SDN80569.1 methylmalonyl-CoA epimerase [Psychrobacillus sp. OK028]
MKLGQIAVNVENVERAVAFYKDVIQLPLLFEMNGLAFFQCGETRLLLSRPETEEFNHPSSVLYFQVDNLTNEVSRMKEAGATFIDEPHMVAKVGDTETWMAFFKDSEGNTLALMNER